MSVIEPRPPKKSAPSPASASPVIDREAPVVELHLSIAKDGLGLELGRAAQIACLSVTELTVVLPGARFPLDVTGGVSRFRHRRGQLRRIAVEVGARGLERWAAPRLRGLLGPRAPDVEVSPRPRGATIAILDEQEGRILVFDLCVDTRDDSVRLTVSRARGADLPRPATALAIAALEAAAGPWAAREGARFVLDRAAARLARALLPDAGARAPSSEGIRWTSIGADADAWILHASADGVPAEADEASARAREAARITRDGDDARLAGELDRARALDLAALERAPSHPEVCRRIAEIDAHAGGRAEAALATLAEADRDGPAHLGLLAGELLCETGDVNAAIATLIRVGESEPVGALAARAYERAAELVTDPLDALVWLDLAIARAPSSARFYWARVERRLAAGRIEDAMADVEHLEAIAHGARDKHAVWRRAGSAWLNAGQKRDATTLFERALLYLPDDPEALGGLGTALADEGRKARGAALLAHAIELAEARGETRPKMVLELAQTLAALGDRPAAIARARTIGAEHPEATLARGLEARWRTELGDVAGASLAYARMRERADSPDAVPLLLAAARFDRDTRMDPASAQRHLATALRFRPQDPEVLREYREIGQVLSGAARAEILAPPAPPRSLDLAPASLEAAGGSEADPDSAMAIRVEELTRKLQGDPQNDAVADELTTLLLRLGRSHELLALLSARIEDASPERRAELVPKQRTVLARLEDEARDGGRPLEADLFKMAREALDDQLP